ncbi:MAG TPA: formate dehydrogenase accessory protein FdhE [Gemmatimonadales bacterium]
MSRTAGGLRSDPATRLAEVAQRRPEWQGWIGLLDVARRAMNETWSVALTPARPSPGAGPREPLLHNRTLRVDAGPARALIDELGLRLSRADSLALLSAAIGGDTAIIQRLAAQLEVDAAALESRAQMAALPLLQACRQQLQSLLPQFWSESYCPICAAWPVLAERRGLDRSRRLRCGRCATDWEVEWLYCIYCGERDHRKLGTLLPDESGEMLKVETCDTCHGYLKSIASLQGFQPLELLLQDLETVELDLVALERGYHRPQQSGFPLTMQLCDDASGAGL